MLSNLSHPCLPTQSLAQSSVPSIHMHWQVVNTGCGDDDFFLLGAAALYGQRKLGRRAATLPSSTELMYIFFAVDSMCLLHASGLLSPPFAPARRAHPATGRPVLSPLSPGAAACTPPWRPLCARGRRSRASPGQGPSSGPSSTSRPKISAPAAGRARAIVEAAGWRCRRHREWLSYRVGGTFHRGAVRWSGRKWSKLFLLQKWIDLGELILAVQTVLKVLHSFDFSLTVFELEAISGYWWNYASPVLLQTLSSLWGPKMAP